MIFNKRNLKAAFFIFNNGNLKMAKNLVYILEIKGMQVLYKASHINNYA